MSSKRLLTIVLAVCFLSGASIYWYLTKDTRRINKRFDHMITQFSKEGPESDLDSLTKTVAVANTFAKQTTIDYGGSQYEIGADRIRGGVHELRGASGTISVEIDQRELHLDRASGKAKMSLQARLIINRSDNPLPDKADVELLWIKDEEAGDWYIEGINVRDLEAP